MPRRIALQLLRSNPIIHFQTHSADDIQMYMKENLIEKVHIFSEQLYHESSILATPFPCR